MRHIIFDIEGNGLGEVYIDKKKNLQTECSRIHLLVLRSFDGEVRVFRHNEDENTIPEGWAILQAADTVVGHNIIQYDLPVLRRIYGGDVRGRIFDTLVAARVLWPDAKNHPYGGNSLKALGMHLGVMKGDYDGGWETWNQEMEDYCVQDTLVSQHIFDFVTAQVRRKNQSGPVKLEHRVATICAAMQDNGVSIDVPAAESFIEQMEMQQATAEAALQAAFPPRIETMKTVAHWLCPDTGTQYVTKSKAPGRLRKHLLAGPFKTKEHPFNPGSSAQIAERFKEKYGWDAPLTKAGNPSVGEAVLKTLNYPEADLMLRAQMADKRLQHLVDWTRRARASRTPGRIHPQINPCGCATSRGSHQQPNQTACPKVLADDSGILMGYEGRYGWEMRSLWGPREGWVQVGGDASGIELRCLGHALSPYDGGEYAREVVEGDVHQRTADATGMTRSGVKTPTYATLYGASAGHLDDLCGGKGKGAKFKADFEAGIKGFTRLKSWCSQCASERGWIPLPDGRRVPVRSEHAALNTLLQGTGAIIMKVAMVILDNTIERQGWRDLCGWMLWPHDEFQLEAHSSIAEELGQALVGSIVTAGEKLNIQCPLDGEYKVGRNWAETH